ncbi:MAG: SpoIIIAH-like family protein [Clostridia bacterium]|nr:SpoIIIAH-like family protein [Clostridia bacterium]
MHILLEKRHIVLAALVVMLGLAVFVNWYTSGTKTELSPEGTAEHTTVSGEVADGVAKFTSGDEEDAFAEMRLNRASSRGEALEQLQAVMADADENSEEALSAGAAIDAITQASRMETDIESLVTAAIGGSCIAVISENAVDVVVSAGSLNDTAALRIHDIIDGVCGDQFENVRISAARDE